MLLGALGELGLESWFFFGSSGRNGRTGRTDHSAEADRMVCLFARCGLAFWPGVLGLSVGAALPFGLCGLAFWPVLLGFSAWAAWPFALCCLAFRPVQLGFSAGVAWLFGRCSLPFWPVRLGFSAGVACAFGRGGVGQRLRCGPWPFSGIRSRSGSAGSRGGRSMRA